MTTRSCGPRSRPVSFYEPGNNTTIRVQLGKSIAGYVGLTGNSLNIRDAYFDERFDKSNDEMTGFKTKTILAVPIFNMAGEVEGVMQAINKKPDEEGNQQYFDRNDTGLLEMVSSLASSNINNTIQFNQQLGTMNAFRTILRCTGQLFGIGNVKEFCSRAAKMLGRLFSCSQVKVYIVNPRDRAKIVTFDDGGIRAENDLTGIIGDCIENKQIISVLNSQNDHRYNGKRHAEQV